MYVDAHCHCHEIPVDKLRAIIKERGIVIACVSDDVLSSHRTIELAESIGDKVVPCIGIHPWSVGESPESDLDEISKIVDQFEITCIGEVGLDTRFVPETIEKQRRYFEFFTNLAREYGLTMNVHAAGAWEEVLEILVRKDVEKAHIHWYTGPKSLLEEILDAGYTIGANPAWKIQKKHQAILVEAPLEIIVTESDAPYKYRGIEMEPTMVIDTIEFLSKERGISISDLASIIASNFRRTFLV